MDPRHRDNLLPFLERTADRWNLACWLDVMRMPWFETTDAAEDALNDLCRELEHDDWLERTPLVRKLREHAARRTRLGRLHTRVGNRWYDLRHGG